MRLLFFVFSIVLFVYFLFSPGETTYDYFTRLSSSLLNGKLYITQNPSWLNELVPIGDKYYIVYPPMPAILLMPYVLIFGENASQTIFSVLLGAINSALVYILIRRLKFSLKTSLLITLFFAFGTNHWYLSSVGSAWFIAHITALLFLLLALIETFGKQRLLLIGLFIGASFWARTPVIFTLPFFYIFLKDKFWPLDKRISNFILLNLGIILFVLLDAFYNFLRFGNFSPFSPYSLIPNISKDPIFQKGFMSIYYIPRHLEAIFLKLPILSNSKPYVLPSLYSTALWFTSPVIIYAFKAKRSLLMIACWVSIIATFSIIILWGGVGFAQFGYRFAQDFMPFILILMAHGIGQRPSKIAYLLVALSILVNFWGVYMINILGKWAW